MVSQYDLDLMKELYTGWGFIIDPTRKCVNRAFALQKKGLLKGVYLHDEKLYGKLTRKGVKILREEELSEEG